MTNTTPNVHPDSELLRQMCSRHLLGRDDPWQFGYEGDVQMTMYVDLMSAAHIDKELDNMSAILARFLLRELNTEDFCVVGPKRGNVLLQRDVARRLQRPSAFAVDPPLFGRWIEGIISADSEAVVVDDISSEGDILLSAVERVRECGHIVRSVFVLINRDEGDAADVLGRHGVRLHYILSLSDDDLSRCIRNPYVEAM
jgi:orotate phosphoribosyltransferase